jgi:hypothetical protein
MGLYRTLLIVGAASTWSCARSCPVSPQSTPAAADAAAPARTALASPRTGAARWVPRIAPAQLEAFRSKMIAPVTNNAGTAATTYLGHQRAGLLHGGARLLWENGALFPVDSADASSRGFDSVVSVPSGLGGGFIFSGDSGLAFADTFDGALRRLSDHRAKFALGPGAVLVFGADGDDSRSVFLSTKDGKALAGAPRDVGRLFTHRNGLTLATSVASSASDRSESPSWFTPDGEIWKELALGRVDVAVEDGDGLLVFAGGSGVDTRSLHLGRDGALTPVTLPKDDAFARRTAGQLAQLSPVTTTAPDDVFEGSLYDAGWAPTGRDDEWLTAQDRRVCTFHARTAERACSDATVGRAEDFCSAIDMGGAPFIGCFALGQRMSLFRVDLATRSAALERTIEVKNGFATHMGAVAGTYPVTQMVAASCDGDAKKGICVRDARGEWRSFPVPSASAKLRRQTVLPFPGELLLLSWTEAGRMVLESVGTSERRVFEPPETDRMQAELGLTPGDAGTGELSVVETGTLRTADGIRMFHGPSPFKETGRHESYALDVPLTKGKLLAVKRVSGVVAPAGLHALRLDDGKLWETHDAWATWTEVAPPPTGVPADLGGAMCDDRGCVVGAWARLGWDNH